jgi:excisionase family DNA binding protein
VVMTDERLFTVTEVAEKLRTSEETVRNWLREGRLGGLRIGGKRTGWRISESDLAAFLQRAREKPADDTSDA